MLFPFDLGPCALPDSFVVTKMLTCTASPLSFISIVSETPRMLLVETCPPRLRPGGLLLLGSFLAFLLPETVFLNTFSDTYLSSNVQPNASTGLLPTGQILLLGRERLSLGSS